MKRFLSVFFLIATCGAAMSAQTLQTSYFCQDFAYSYRLNPAFHPDYSFAGLPMIGSSSVSYKGDFAIGDVFYKNGGEKVTFMNSSVSSSDFLKNFSKGLNKFSSESYINLASIGFEAGGMYNIVDLNLRSYNSGKLPYDLMRFLKDGASADGTFDLSGLHAHSTAFAEIGITSSWNINRKLTIGMRFKGVIGLENSYIDMNRMNITHSGDSWSVTSDGVIASAYDGYGIKTRPASFDPSVELLDLRNTEFGKPKELMNGYGVGADLGILYDDSSWQFSASLSDIGCIFWFHNLYGNAPGQAITYDATYTPHNHSGKKIDNEFSDMGDMLADVLGFKAEDEYQSLGLLPMTARLGAKYLYLSELYFGGLATFRYDDICPFWDLRGSVGYKPSKVVELIGSLGVGSLGVSLGAFANIKWKCLNFFAGTDNLLGTSGTGFMTATKGAPHYAFGLNVTW